MRIRKTSLPLCLLMLLPLSAFAGGTDEATADEGPITLTVWDFKYGDEKTRMAMDEVDAAFMAANPGVLIDHQPQPNDNYYDLLRAAAAANDGPDVALVHAERKTWDLADVMVSLDDSIASWKNEIDDLAWNASRAFNDPANPIIMIPITQQGFGMYYNKDLFAKAGLDPNNPPADEEAFLAACAKLKAAGFIPVAEQRSGYPKSMMYMTRMLLTNAYGPELSQTKINYSDPEIRTIVEFLVRLTENGYFDPDANSLNYWSDVLPKFRNGEVGMIYGLLSDIAHWKDFSDALGKENVGYFPNINLKGLPYADMQGVNGAGIGYSVFQWSRHKEAAIAYASFYARQEGARIFMNELGALTPNIALDISAMNYPALEDVLESMNAHPVLNSTPSIPGVAQKAFEQEQSMLLMLGEITVDEFLETTQEILAAERAAQ